jgi:hypothetical protein
VSYTTVIVASAQCSKESDHMVASGIDTYEEATLARCIQGGVDVVDKAGVAGVLSRDWAARPG